MSLYKQLVTRLNVDCRACLSFTIIYQHSQIQPIHHPLHNASLSNTNSQATKVISITDFFYDDPTMPYAPLPAHDLDQSPCYVIIDIKDGYYYCRLHPEIKKIVWKR